MAVEHDATVLYMPVLLDHIAAMQQLGVWSLTMRQFLGAKLLPLRMMMGTASAVDNTTHRKMPLNGGGIQGGGWLEHCPTLCHAPHQLQQQQLQPESQEQEDNDLEKDDMDHVNLSSKFSNHCQVHYHHYPDHGYWMQHCNGAGKWIFSSTIHHHDIVAC